MADSARGLPRHYRIGPADLAYDDPVYLHRVEVFDGVGLRPYRPGHLRLRETGGDLELRWVRRTREGGDSWVGTDVPLGEEREAYRVEIMRGGTLLRGWEVTEPRAVYAAADRMSDGPGPVTVRVAQLSVRWGAGPFTEVTTDG